ncbi:MAG: ThiF family adenylyltransferase [Gemmatimonadota bacterium]|nr:ThiF family adenylyltransferase [Gemmatimonadota bacterium]
MGLGGGGSHVVQQLAHLGFQHLVIVDPDRVDETNLNRLVGASLADALNGTPKTEVAQRTLDRLGVGDNCRLHQGRWQDRPEMIRGCDLIIGCVDSFNERRELETIARRYLIPYIDIGMDVHVMHGQASRIGGQLFASIPGQPCMFCIGLLNEERLSIEAARYGDAGARPQVVWPNGILGSTAVGVAVNLVTGWSVTTPLTYLSYDGNTGTISPHPRLPFVKDARCSHYSLSDVGDPTLAHVLSGE